MSLLARSLPLLAFSKNDRFFSSLNLLDKFSYSSTKMSTQIQFLKDVLENWWQFKENHCPLCKKKMILSSISRHIKGDFCPSLLELSPIQRSEVAEHFSNLKIQFGGRRFSPHELSPNEKVAASICSILGYRYQPHLEWLCKIMDGSTTWISNNLLSLTRVGNKWIKRGQRARNKGLLKEILEDSGTSITFFSEQKISNKEKEKEEVIRDEPEQIELSSQEEETENSDLSLEPSLSPEIEKVEREETLEEDSKEEIQSESEKESGKESSEEEEYEVEKILEKKKIRGKTYYKVQWVGYEETTWEPSENLEGCKQILAEFHRHQKVPMSCFQFQAIERFKALQYLVD